MSRSKTSAFHTASASSRPGRRGPGSHRRRVWERKAATKSLHGSTFPPTALSPRVLRARYSLLAPGSTPDLRGWRVLPVCDRPGEERDPVPWLIASDPVADTPHSSSQGVLVSFHLFTRVKQGTSMETTRTREPTDSAPPTHLGFSGRCRLIRPFSSVSPRLAPCGLCSAKGAFAAPTASRSGAVPVSRRIFGPVVPAGKVLSYSFEAKPNRNPLWGAPRAHARKESTRHSSLRMNARAFWIESVTHRRWITSRSLDSSIVEIPLLFRKDLNRVTTLPIWLYRAGTCMLPVEKFRSAADRDERSVFGVRASRLLSCAKGDGEQAEDCCNGAGLPAPTDTSIGLTFREGGGSHQTSA